MAVVPNIAAAGGVLLLRCDVHAYCKMLSMYPVLKKIYSQ